MFNETTWKLGEKLAAKYLQKKKYKILHTNYRICGVEIDIIAVEKAKLIKKQYKQLYKSGEICKSAYLTNAKSAANCLVFIEVKSRATNVYGLPEAAVDVFKQNHIKRGASAYIKKFKLDDCAIRFDVIGVLNKEITHIKNAFN